MKKIINIVLMLSLVFAFAPSVSAVNDVTLSTGSQITVDGKTFTLSGTVDDIVAHDSYFSVTISSGGEIYVYSDDKYNLTTSSQDGVTRDCTMTQSVLYIVNTTTTTYSVTPDESLCSYSGGNSNPGGGSSSGPSSPPDSTSTGIINTGLNVDTVSSEGNLVSLESPVTQTVTSDGGTASLGDGSLTFALPANSVTSEASLSITPQANYPQPSTGYSAVGSQIYNITVQETDGGSVTNLGAEATLTFIYTDIDVANLDESTLVVSYWDEATGQWIDLETTVDLNNNTVTANVNHLTKFIIQGESVSVPLGSLIKTNDTTAVYYLGHDSKRYVFPDERVFFSWYTGFDDVLTVTNEEMTSFAMGSTVTVRPGTELVQFIQYDIYGNMMVDDPNVYAIESGGVRRWIETAEIATALYGTNWESKIVPVKNVLIGDYTLGDSISEAVYPTGAVVKETNSGNIFYISNGQKRTVTINGLTSNRIQEKFYLETPNLDTYTDTLVLNDYQNSISWTSGK